MSKTGSLVKFTQIDPTIAVNLHILNAGYELVEGANIGILEF